MMNTIEHAVVFSPNAGYWVSPSSLLVSAVVDNEVIVLFRGTEYDCNKHMNTMIADNEAFMESKYGYGD